MSSSTIVTGYCPKCRQNVLLTRQKMDFCIALMLLIFTAGFGLIIYYYARDKNRCVHCGSFCQFMIPENQVLNSETQSSEIRGISANFCNFCGLELENETVKTCPNCESKI